MAALSDLGVDAPSRATVAGWVGISSQTGTFRTYLSELRQAGYIDDGVAGSIALTPAGLDEAEDEVSIASLADLHAVWMRKLGGTAGRILAVIIERYPDSVAREELGEAVNISWATGTFRTYLSELRSPGLIRDESRGGRVVATELLFPVGLTR